MLLGVASVWDSRKGLAYFLELEKLIPESLRIVLVGLTKEQMQSLPERITAIERTNSVSELRELYGIADVFVNPTLEDNYPTTNLEAIACGTPVITFDTGGSPESAELFGCTIDEKSAEQIYERIMNPVFHMKKYDYSAARMVNDYLEMLIGD